MMKAEDISTIIRKYLLDNFLFFEEDINFDDNVSFLDIDILDSTGIIELVTFVEEEFNISVKDDEITRNNFDSIETLTIYITKRIDLK